MIFCTFSHSYIFSSRNLMSAFYTSLFLFSIDKIFIQFFANFQQNICWNIVIKNCALTNCYRLSQITKRNCTLNFSQNLYPGKNNPEKSHLKFIGSIWAGWFVRIITFAFQNCIATIKSRIAIGPIFWWNRKEWTIMALVHS